MRLPSLSTLPTRCCVDVWDGRHAPRKTAADDRNISPDRQNPGVRKVKLERDYRTCRRKRRGAAVVEFAVVAPVFFLMIFGMIECGQAIMVQQVLTNAAREGARVAVLDSQTPTHDLVVSKVTTYLQSSGITGTTVAISPNEPTSATYGQPVTVTVTVPFNNISWMPSPWFMKTKTLTGRSVMRRETVQ
jgi:Flp pilus assembly protein TadG